LIEILFLLISDPIKEKEENNFSKPEGKNIRATFFEYFITKNIPEQKVYYYDKIAGKQIFYQEDRPIKWEITQATEKQNGYAAQKLLLLLEEESGLHGLQKRFLFLTAL
jgi:GLPGLI family protein